MRRFVLVVLLGVSIVAAAVARPAAAFEGVLKWRMLKVGTGALGKVAGDSSDPEKVFAVPLEQLMKMHGEATVTEATMYVKGSKLRTESTARDGQGYFLMDLETGVTQVVMPKEKKVLEVTKEDVRAAESRGQAVRSLMRRRRADVPADKQGRLGALLDPATADEEEATFKLVPTGRSETIRGMKASAYQVRGERQTVQGWVTQDRPDLQQLLRRIERKRDEIAQRRNAAERPRDALAEAGLPVRVQTLERGDYTWEEMVEVEEKPLADGLFAAPADFARTTVGALTHGQGQAAPPETQR